MVKRIVADSEEEGVGLRHRFVNGSLEIRRGNRPNRRSAS